MLVHLATIAALTLGTGAVARSQSPAPAPARDAAEAARAADRARLAAQYEQLQAELRAAVATYTLQVQDLQQRQVPPDKWPAHPSAVHYPRFEELAFLDQPDALRWCLGMLGQIGLQPQAMLDRKREIYARLVVVHPDLPWMAEVTRWLQADATPGGIGFEDADALLRELADATSVRGTRAAALGVRATLLAGRPDPAARAASLALLEELASKYADTPQGAQARGRLFQQRHLSVGGTPPDVEATDVDGKPFKLSDYRGKVVVLEFWGFW